MKTVSTTPTFTANPKNHEDFTRRDSYVVDPRTIVIADEDKALNPRYEENYVHRNETPDFVELKESIRTSGLRMPISVYISKKDGKPHLAHGFRRLHAVLDLIAEGVEIKTVPVIHSSDNAQTRAAEHIILNRSRLLNDAELAIGVANYIRISGVSVKEAAATLTIDYNKAVRLVSLAENAGKQLMQAMLSDEIAVTTGFMLAELPTDVQVEKIAELRKGVAQTSESTGAPVKRIRNAQVMESLGKTTLVTRFKQLANVADELGSDSSFDFARYNEFAQVLNELKDMEGNVTSETLKFLFPSKK
jgi:hypothetical protein